MHALILTPPYPIPPRSILEDRCAPMAWEADAPPDMAGQPKLSSYLTKGPTAAAKGGGAKLDAPSSGAGRHAFFRLRRMERAAAL